MFAFLLCFYKLRTTQILLVWINDSFCDEIVKMKMLPFDWSVGRAVTRLHN